MILRGRYTAMLPPSDLSNMPPTAQIAIDHSRSLFIAADRGHVRQNNDQSVDSRARFFAEWLESLGHTKQSAIAMTNDQLIDTLGAYLEDVKKGNNLQKLHLTGQSLRNYVTAARCACHY